MPGAGFLHLPMTFNGLVIESTSRCNARCGMCYQGAGPKGSDLIGDHALQAEEIKEVLRDGLSIPGLAKRFHLAGGEAFIDADTCIELFDYAKGIGYIDLTATTNAYWAADIFKARAIAKRLRRAGLRNLEVSWDGWHTPYISPKAIDNCILAAADNDIQVNLRVLTTRKERLADSLRLLSAAALQTIGQITSAPVFPVGRGESIPDEDVYGEGELANCHAVLNLTVNARGDVFPCCAGFDQTDAALFGNIRERSIKEIAVEMSQSVLIRTLPDSVSFSA